MENTVSREPNSRVARTRENIDRSFFEAIRVLSENSPTEEVRKGWEQLKEGYINNAKSDYHAFCMWFALRDQLIEAGLAEDDGEAAVIIEDKEGNRIPMKTLEQFQGWWEEQCPS